MSIASRIQSIADHIDDAYDTIIAKGGLASDILPSGYTQVEYLGSSGTQYIDTGVNADINLDVEIDLQYTSVNGTNTNTMFGAIYQNGSSYKRYHINVMGVYINFFILQDEYTALNRYDTNKHNYYIKAKDRRVLVDNVNYSLLTAYVSDTTLNFWLFGRNSNISNLQMFNSSKLYNCKLYYNEILVRNFIPCYRNSDNEPGLYDLVNDVFYTNQGTGTFTVGSPVASIDKNIENLSSAIASIPSGGE